MVECARLESVYTARYRGFESLSLRSSEYQKIGTSENQIFWSSGILIFRSSGLLSGFVWCTIRLSAGMDDVELIQEKLNIVDVISEYIPLKKAGVNFKANCPFHGERTPSFVVSPERRIWHCFGCDRGGNVFKFVMEKEGLDFKDTLELLAQKAGVVLQKTSKVKNPHDRIFEINLKAAQFFQYMLKEHVLGKKALEYLEKRGLTKETIDAFGIGYAPQNWEALTRFLKQRGFSVDEMTTSGLCVPSKRGCYDRFRGRIIFPLIDARGRVLGFSGRILDKGEPKYINTPQTPIFDKGKLFFGLNLAKGSVREKKEAIVVEGEMDMIMSYQSGVKNIVASKGTALTEDQISVIKQYSESINLCFDTDLAGDAASRRGIEIADRAGLNIKVVQVEGAKDPAEVCVSDPKAWKEMVKNATPIYDYYLQSAERRFGIKTAEGKRAIFNELLPIWRKITDPVVKEHYIQKLSALLLVKDDVIRKHLDSFKGDARVQPINNTVSRQASAPAKQEKIVHKDRRRLLEEYLISLILHIPIDHTFVPTFPETIFTQEELKQVYVLLVIFLDSISFKGRAFKIQEFVKTIPAELMPVVDQLYLTEIDNKLTEKRYWQKEVDSVVAELKKMLIKSSLEKLSLRIKSAQEFDKIETLEVLNKRFRDLSLKLKNL